MLENIRADSWGSIPPLRMPSLLPHDLCHKWNASPTPGILFSQQIVTCQLCLGCCISMFANLVRSWSTGGRWRSEQSLRVPKLIWTPLTWWPWVCLALVGWLTSPILLHFKIGNKIPSQQLTRACMVMLSRVWTLRVPGQWATRLLCPWDFSGKNIGVGYHFLL